MPALDVLRLDLRTALAAMRVKPGVAVFAVLTLALGIGMNVSTLAVAYGILLRPLPYPDPSRIFVLNLLFADGGDLGIASSAAPDWLSRLRTTEVAAAYYRRDITVRAAGRSVVVPAAVVTDRFFEVLGAPAAAGRAHVSAGSSEVVIGRRRVADILGPDAERPLDASVTVAGVPRVIGGVLPSDFAMPDDEIGVWLPLRAAVPGAAPDGGGYSRIVARLRPGVTLEQFREDANRVRLELDPKSADVVSVGALAEDTTAPLRRLLVAAVAGSLLVLLVAAANVATLFIGRDLSRQRELATRIALGAGRAALVRGILIEALVIAVAASVAGIALGTAALRLFVGSASAALPSLHRARIDAPVVVLIAVLTVAVSAVCAAVPAWSAARLDFGSLLRPTSGSRPRTWRGRRVLVVAQIACCSLLLVGAGLLGRTVSAIAHEDHGFQPRHALEAKLVLADAALLGGTNREPFVRALLDRVRSLPAVQTAGFGSNLPPRTPLISMAIRIVDVGRDDTRRMNVVSATPGFLPAVGAHFLAGRDFEDADVNSGAAVVILSESVARFYFPGVDPIGRTIARLPAMLGMSDPARVVGVVRDVKYEALDAPAGSTVFVPWARRPFGTGYLVARTAADPLRIAGDVRRAVQTLDPTVPVAELQTVEDAVAGTLAARRMRAVPAAGFAVLGLGVALVGLLGTLTMMVTERRRDLAIRAALGASPARLMGIVAGQGILLTAAGLAIGIVTAAASARALSPLVYRISPYDPITFGGTALVMGGSAAVIIGLAALRVLRVDPLAVLRHE